MQLTAEKVIYITEESPNLHLIAFFPSLPFLVLL